MSYVVGDRRDEEVARALRTQGPVEVTAPECVKAGCSDTGVRGGGQSMWVMTTAVRPGMNAAQSVADGAAASYSQDWE